MFQKSTHPRVCFLSFFPSHPRGSSHSGSHILSYTLLWAWHRGQCSPCPGGLCGPSLTPLLVTTGASESGPPSKLSLCTRGVLGGQYRHPSPSGLHSTPHKTVVVVQSLSPVRLLCPPQFSTRALIFNFRAGGQGATLRCLSFSQSASR